MNISFSIDNNYVPYCLITICSICENNKNEEINFFILNRDISNNNKQLINDFVSKYNCNVTFLEIKIDLINTFPINTQYQTNKYISIETYFRLFLTELLPAEIEKIIYLDSDIIVCNSLKELWDTDISNVALAAVKDNEYYSVADYNRLRYEPKYGYFNAGVLLINLKYWREHQSYNKFMNYIRDNPERLKKHDQDVLNFIFYNEKKWLPLRYNLLVGFVCKELPFPYLEWDDIYEAQKNPCIIHYSDKIKPWFMDCLHPYKSLFYKYQKLTPFADMPLIKTKLTKKQQLKHILAKVHLCSDIEKRKDFYDHSINIEHLL